MGNKRILAIIVFTISTIFLIASLAGLVAVWVMNQPLTNTLLTEIQLAREDLQSASATLDTVEGELILLGDQIDTFQYVIDTLGDDAVNNTQIVADVVSGVEDKIAPLISGAESGVNTLYETFQSIKEILESLNQLPLVSIEIPGGETIESILDQIESLQDQIQDTKTDVDRVAQTTKELVTTLTTNFENWETFVSESLTELEIYQSRIAEYDERLSNLEENLPNWIDLTSIFITLFLFWMIISQAGLIYVSIILIWKRDLDLSWK